MQKHSDYVPLHLHTEYSLLDGAIRIGELAETAVRMGMPAVAITDHGNLFGAVEFYKTASKAGLKPVIGCEVYVAPKGRPKRAAVSTSYSLQRTMRATGTLLRSFPAPTPRASTTSRG